MSDWGTTTRIRAVVTLASGDLYPGYIHLLDGVHAPHCPESPLEMLNRPEGFFPLTLDDGSAFLISKAQVAVVVPEWPVDGVETWDPPARRARLHVALATGEELAGDARVIGPAGHSRALDYLNVTAPFFQLETDGGSRLINRAFVQLIRPLD